MVPERLYDRRMIKLPTFPGFILPVAFTSDGTVWIPIKPIFDALGIKNRVQRDRLRADSNFDDVLDMIPFATTKGSRDILSAEWEGFGGMLTQIQDRRIGNSEARQRRRTFRKQAWKVINDIVLARNDRLMPLSADEVPGLRPLALPTEDRVSRFEHILLIQPEDDISERRHARCPNCGGPLTVFIGRVSAVDEEE
jgi:P22_AR N-terminal domain